MLVDYPKLTTRMYHHVDKYSILFVGHYFLHWYSQSRSLNEEQGEKRIMVTIHKYFGIFNVQKFSFLGNSRAFSDKILIKGLFVDLKGYCCCFEAFLIFFVYFCRALERTLKDSVTSLKPLQRLSSWLILHCSIWKFQL